MIVHRLLLGSLLVANAPAVEAKAPTAAPRAVVERFLADYAAERADAMQSYIAADAQMRTPFAPTGPVVLDTAQAMAYLRSVFARYAAITFSDVVLTPAADGRTVFFEGKATYTDRAGVSHSVGNIWAIEVVGGKIVRSRIYNFGG
jgi:ketosteroid isomerase-like protein